MLFVRVNMEMACTSYWMERYAYIFMLLDVREAKTVSQVSLGCLGYL